MITLQIDYQAIQAAIRTLQKFPGAIKKANKMALGRAMDRMRTTAARAITARYYIKMGDVRKSISVKFSGTDASFIVRGARKSLSYFHMTPKKAPAKNGLRVAVRKDTGIKRIAKGFIIHGRGSGRALPFIRTGRARGDIKHLISPAIPQTIEKNEEVQNEIINAGQEAYVKNFEYWASKITRTGGIK